MAQYGPVPNRTEDLSRERDANRGGRPEVTKGILRDKHWPDPDPAWSATATMIWEAAQESGQEDFYQQSDIALLWMMCEEITAYAEPQPVKDRKTGAVILKEDGTPLMSVKRSPMHLTAIMSGLSDLLLSEAQRRRVRMELEPEPQEDDAAVLAIAEYRKEQGLEA